MTVRDELLTPKASGCVTCYALRTLTPNDAQLLDAALVNPEVPSTQIAQWLSLNGHPLKDAKSVANHRKSHVDRQG